MPKIAQELFLVGSIDKTQPGIFSKELVNRKPYYRRIRKEFSKTSVKFSLMKRYVFVLKLIKKLSLFSNNNEKASIIFGLNKIAKMKKFYNVMFFLGLLLCISGIFVPTVSNNTRFFLVFGMLIMTHFLFDINTKQK